MTLRWLYLAGMRGGLSAFCILILGTVQCLAQTVIAGPISNPGNEHNYYLLDRSSWSDAERIAVQMGGHLATIRNSDEQNWVLNTFGRFGGVDRNLWIGLYDADPITNSENPAARASEFVWSSGEPVGYSNWNTAEPNNYRGVGESVAHMWLPGRGVDGLWNDSTDNPVDNQPAFPWNGVVEVYGTPSVIAGPIINPSNNHKYYLLDWSSWSAAEAMAVSLGGHLATVRNEGEQTWILGVFGRFGDVSRNLWIGLHDANPSSNSNDPAFRRNEFVWSSGEPVQYSFWNEGEPNNYLDWNESAVQLLAPNRYAMGPWNDAMNNPLDNQPSNPYNGVVEVSGPLEIQCPRDITIECQRVDPQFTGYPTIISSCAPPGQLIFEFRDDFPFGFGSTIYRTWRVQDPFCGTEQSCVQIINPLTPFVSATVSVDRLQGGTILQFRAHLSENASVQSADWFIDNQQIFSDFGVIIQNDFMQIDLTKYFSESFQPGRNFEVRCTGNIRFNDSCFGQFGGTGIGIGAPTFGVSTGQKSTTNVKQSDPNQGSYAANCGSFGGNTKWFVYHTYQSAIMKVDVTAPQAQPHILVLNYAGGFQLAEIACGTRKVFFETRNNENYIVLVDQPGDFAIASELQEPTKEFSVSPFVDFGFAKLGSSNKGTLVIRNLGNQPIEMHPIDFTPPFYSTWRGTYILPGDSFGVEVEFRPDYIGAVGLPVGVFMTDFGPQYTCYLLGKGYDRLSFDLSQTFLENGTYNMMMSGFENAGRFAVDISDDLIHWTPWRDFDFTASSQEAIQDAVDPSKPRQFYRFRSN